jgi:hypothetical protein
MFARHAADATAVEQTLHRSLLASLGIDPAAAATAKPAPTNLACTSYLLAAITGSSHAEAAGAALPLLLHQRTGRQRTRPPCHQTDPPPVLVLLLSLNVSHRARRRHPPGTAAADDHSRG